MAIVPYPSQRPSSVTTAMPYAAHREHQADQRAEVLEQHDRQLGGLGPADELPVAGVAAFTLSASLDGGAEREGLGDDREAAGCRWPTAGSRSARGARSCGCPRRWRRAQPRENSTRATTKRPEVPLAPVAERVLLVGGLLGPPAAEEQQALVARVGHGVDALGQHRRGAGHREAGELGDRDRQVGEQRGDDRLRPVPVSPLVAVRCGIGLLLVAGFVGHRQVAPGGWRAVGMVDRRAGPFGVRPHRRARPGEPAACGSWCAGCWPWSSAWCACRAGGRSGPSTTRPRRRAAGVFVGRNEVVGQAVPLYQPIVTPFTQTPSVWFSWHLERYKSYGDDKEWVTVEKRSTSAPFWIQDDTGRSWSGPATPSSSRLGLTETLDHDFAPPYSRWQLRQWVLVGEDVQERHQAMATPASAWPPTVDGGWFRQHARHRRARSRRCRASTASPRSASGRCPDLPARHRPPRTDANGLEFAGEEDPLVVPPSPRQQVASSSGWSARLAAGSAACS